MESVSGILNSEAERAPFLHGDAPVSPVPPGAASPAGDALPVAAEAEPAPCRPQQIQVEVAPDAMTAHVSLDPGDSGTPVALADVFDALIAAGVLHGLDDAALRQACETPGPQHFVAARATPPQKGEDASFEFLITDHRERAPKLNAQGLIDFREHGEVPVVDVGQPLIRRTPASAGAAGSD
ncbi:MAG: FapA family protein, partial [Rubrivivax sp.]|nr:FapA family protein [Rubrivivax sp.]